MLPPDKLATILRKEMFARDVDFEECNKEGEKWYRYRLEFAEYQTFRLLRRNLSRIIDNEDLDLQITGVEPVIHMSKSSVEARIQVTVKEQFDRYEEENRQLGEFNVGT